MSRFSKAVLDRGRNLIERYCLAENKAVYRHADVYEWAVERNELPVGTEAVRLINLEVLHEASRTDTIKGPEGRIRVRHCVEGVRANGNGEDDPHRETLWAHIDDAPYSFMVESFRQRRGRIAADVRQLRLDLEHANEVFRERGEREIQLSFDFTEPEEDEPEEEAS